MKLCRVSRYQQGLCSRQAPELTAKNKLFQWSNYGMIAATGGADHQGPTMSDVNDEDDTMED